MVKTIRTPSGQQKAVELLYAIFEGDGATEERDASTLLCDCY